MKLLRTWHDHAWIEKVIAWSASILTGAFVGHLLWLLQEKIPESVSAIPALSGWLQWVLPAGVGLFVLSKLVRPATKLIDAYEDHWTTHLYDMRGLELKVAHQNMRLKERQEITAAKATEAAAEAPAPAEPKRAFPTLEELAKNAPQQSNDA